MKKGPVGSRVAGTMAARVTLASVLVLGATLGLPATAQEGQGRAVAFDHRTGNEWWVEVVLSGPDAATVTRVEAQDEGGPWTALAKKSWGAWAASFRIEPGNDVRFRAGSGGAWTESCWFTHPGGLTPTGGTTCGSTASTSTASPTASATSSPSTSTTSATSTTNSPQPFATFSGTKGNPYWVEVRVASTKPLAGVAASVDDGAWRTLTLREWGAWAASFPIPDGAYVQFRATATDGATALSGDHVWPSARPVTAWPQAGSFVAYTLRNSGGAPDGSWWQTTQATLRLAFDGTSWTGRCTGTTTETDHTGASTTASFDVAVTGLPAQGPTEAAVGDEVDPRLVEGAGFGRCQQAEDVLAIEGRAKQPTSLRDAGGRALSLRAWVGGEPSGHSAYESDAAAWETRLGLMLDWSHSARGGGLEGHLVDTDAPIR